jgi:hypothetical protein
VSKFESYARTADAEPCECNPSVYVNLTPKRPLDVVN